MSYLLVPQGHPSLRLILGTFAALALLASASSGAVLRPYSFTTEHRLTLLVEHSGVEASEIERSITLVLENAAAGLDGVTEMLSHSKNGAGQLELNYRRGYDMETAYLELRDMAEGVAPGLPAGSRTPQILQAGGSEMRSPVFIVAFPEPAEPGFGSANQDNYRGAGAARLSNAELRARYAAVDEVALVEVSGREPEEILIRYRASEVTHNERFGAAAIAQTLRDFSGSLAVRVSGGVSLVVDGRYDSVSKVAETPVDNIHSIGGLAQVNSQPRRAERITQLNGSQGTLVYVMATADADLIPLSGELRSLGRSLVKELDQPLEPLVLYDLGTELRVTLFALMGQVVIGTGAVMVLMVLFLRAGKATWVIFPAVGFACLTPVALLSAVGFSLDGTVLGAVALAAGLAADGAAVVLEFELQSSHGSGSRNIGRHHIWTQPYTAALFFSFLSTAVVFLPLYYAEPAFREAYASFALALCSGLAAATLYTTWIMPQLLRSSYKEHTAATQTPLFSRALLGIESRVCRHRPLVFALLGLTLVVAGARVRSLEYRQEAQVDSGSTTAIVEFPPGTTVAAVVERGVEFEERLLASSGKEFQVLTRSEGARLRMDFIGINEPTAVYLQSVVESETRKGETLYFPGQLSSNAGFTVHVTGPERGVLHDIAREVAERLSMHPDIEDLYFRFREAGPVIEIVPLSPAMRAAGLDTRELASQMHHALGTGVAGKWYTQAGERDIRIQTANIPASIQELHEFPIFTPADGVVGVGTVAEFRSVPGVEGRQRRNRLPTLGLTVIGTDLRALQLREMLAAIPRGSGYFIDVEPVRVETKPPIGIAGAAVVLVFLVVMIACNRLRGAAWAAAPAPVCFLLTLALLSLGSKEAHVELQSLLAAILGLGISVNFSLLYLLTLPSQDPKARTPAAEPWEAKSRIYRACIPATLTTLVGVLPALAGLGGSSMLRPLSLGICASALISLLFLPIWAGLCPLNAHTRRIS